MELRRDNPCDRVGRVLGAQHSVVQHMPALPHREVAAAVATVGGSTAPPFVKLAFEFLVLTAVRSGEVRGAQWTEMDVAAQVWTIPATRMKMRRDHRVPLCGRALAILEAARTLGAGSPLVFPGKGGQAARQQDAAPAAPASAGRGRGARLPVVVPGLGRRGDRPPARGGRGGAGARRPQPG